MNDHTRIVWTGFGSLVGHNRKNGRWYGAVAMAIACVAGAAAAARGANVYPNISFPSPGSPNNVQLMDLFTPSAGPNDQCTVILTHGGGYSTGDKNELTGMAIELADRGYTVISTNYKLVTPAISGPGQGSFPQPSCDVLNVVHWVRTDGQQLGLPSRIVLGGFSAGSTIAIHAAMSVGTTPLNILPPAGPRGYTIDGAIGVFGRYDLNWNVQAFGLPDYVNAYIGLGSVGSAPLGNTAAAPGPAAIYASASAATYVNNCSPPTVLFHGSADGLVPVGNTYRLQQAMTQVGAPVDVRVITGGGHTDTILGPTDAAQAATLDSALHWIFQHVQASCGQDAPPPPPPPPPAGSCCSDMGVCAVSIEIHCDSGMWTLQGACQPNPCIAPPVPGACCMGATCAVMFQAECAGPATNFIGSSTVCNDTTNSVTPCCRADFNKDGIVSVSDVFVFLNAWFAGDPRCLVNDQGLRPTVPHIFMYLNAWFAGC